MRCPNANQEACSYPRCGCHPTRIDSLAEAARQRLADQIGRDAAFHGMLLYLTYLDVKQDLHRRHDRWLAEVRNNRITKFVPQGPFGLTGRYV